MLDVPNEDHLQQVLDAAGSMAARAGVTFNSGHLLLALLSLDNEACPIPVDRGLTTSQVAIQLAQVEAGEGHDMLTRVRDRCQRLAQSCGSRQVSVLHLLIVLCSLQECVACKIIISLGVDPNSLRTVALALITSGVRRGRRRPPRAARSAPEPPAATGAGTASAAGAAEAAVPARTRIERRDLSRRDPRVTRGLTPRPADEELPPGGEQYALDEETLPTVAALGRNLSELAARGATEPLVGRRDLVERILDILGKRRANNPCLVGEPGVGKTAIVEGLAYLQVNEAGAVPFLEGRVLVELNMGSLLSGTQLRGSFSERMANLRQEVEQADGHVILFLDEIHTLVGAGAVGDGALDAVGELSAAMARGSFPCIGATTTDNYKKHIEETPALQRRLQPVLVPEPEVEQTLEILRGVLPSYADHHAVTFHDAALDAAVRLSSRYIADRFLPDKAISLLDLAGSRARRRGVVEVGRSEVAELVAEGSGIPVDRLLMTDTERFLRMEEFLFERIVGHRAIIRRVCQVIRRNYAGFSSDRPIGSFLFLGPTGVGKTETVKVLADFLFQSRDALCRFDMSEFMEPHSVARLIGSPPGYVGHEEGGQLTEAVRRRPYQIVLLDEVEKAHRDVLQVLLQLLDDGRLTDGRGRTVDFSNSVVVMTSNLGSAHYDRGRGPIGFGTRGDTEGGVPDPEEWARVADEVLKTARRAFPIELWNRIEQRAVFEPLGREQILAVARLLVADSSARLHAEKQIGFEATDAALEHLIEHGGYDPVLGARPMRTTIQRLIEGPVAEQILLRQVDSGDQLRVDLVGDRLVVERAARRDTGGEGPPGEHDHDEGRDEAGGTRGEAEGAGVPSDEPDR